MNIIQGQLPEGADWRVLIALKPGIDSSLILKLGIALAKANRGQVVAAAFVSDDSQQSQSTGHALLAGLAELNTENSPPWVYPLLIANPNQQEVIPEIVNKASIDLLLVTADKHQRQDFRKIPCAVGMLRTSPTIDNKPPAPDDLDRILVSTSGGPNSAYALGLLLPLVPQTELTAFYVATSQLGESEEALGRARINQVVDFVDATNKVTKQIIVADSVTEGIIQETNADYDLVVIGASEESRLDQVIFGNIPALVVEQSHKPVLVIRRGTNRFSNAVNLLDWRMQSIIPRKTLSERAEIYARIRRGARPETAFFVLIGLSAMIASLGLIVNSPAVVIGAMLVAPLMSPIIGTGLALVLGDTRFLRLALGAINRGLWLAVFVGFLAGLTAIGRPLSNEILARTTPNLYDLGIALFSGAAAAYALSFSQAAGALPGVAIAAALVPPLATVGITLSAGLAALVTGRINDSGAYLADSLGALLLFTTNFIAISTAAALVFFILGFRPTPSNKARVEVQRRSARFALLLLVAVTLVLGITSYLLARESSTRQRIYTISEKQVTEILDARLNSLEITEFRQQHLRLDLAVFSPRPIPNSKVIELQQSLGQAFANERIANDFGLRISVFQYTELDPLVLPTPISQSPP